MKLLYLLFYSLVLIILILVSYSLYNIIDDIKILNLRRDLNYNEENRINDVNLLGTHNSLTYKIHNYFSPFGKTQSLNLQQQYNIGARYFDLRFKKINNELIAFHGVIDLGLNIKEVFDIFFTILKQNNSFILLSVRKEESKEPINIEKDIYTYFIKNDKTEQVLFNNGINIPTIKDLKNKIFFINIYKDDVEFEFISWPYNTIFSKFNLYVEDVNDTSIENKIKLIKEMLIQHRPSCINIIFFSLQTNIYTSIKYISSTIHKKILDSGVLKDKKGFIFVFDYLNNIYSYKNKLITNIMLE